MQQQQQQQQQAPPPTDTEAVWRAVVELRAAHEQQQRQIVAQQEEIAMLRAAQQEQNEFAQYRMAELEQKTAQHAFMLDGFRDSIVALVQHATEATARANDADERFNLYYGTAADFVMGVFKAQDASHYEMAKKVRVLTERTNALEKALAAANSANVNVANARAPAATAPSSAEVDSFGGKASRPILALMAPPLAPESSMPVTPLARRASAGVLAPSASEASSEAAPSSCASSPRARAPSPLGNAASSDAGSDQRMASDGGALMMKAAMIIATTYNTPNTTTPLALSANKTRIFALPAPAAAAAPSPARPRSILKLGLLAAAHAARLAIDAHKLGLKAVVAHALIGLLAHR
jgi:hypothetical protein